MIPLIAFVLGVLAGIWAYWVVDVEIRWRKYLRQHDYLQQQKQAEVPDDFWKGPGSRAS